MGTRHPAVLRAPKGCSNINTKAVLAVVKHLGRVKSFSESPWGSHFVFLAKILKALRWLSLFRNDSFSLDYLFFRYEFNRSRSVSSKIHSTWDPGSLILRAVLL